MGASRASRANNERLRVFISYSRRDTATADALLAALTANGFDVTIDRRDLEFGEKWQSELAELIRLCDTVVWLVSASSIQSKWVNWELDEVARRNKRLVPVVIGETPRESLPRQIREIHLLPADRLFDVDRDLPDLKRVLETDRAWIKDGSRLSDRAHEWLLKGRPSTLLLRGASLSAAERWRAGRPAKAPPPGQEALDLILTSRQASTGRIVKWAILSAVVALGGVLLAAFAFEQQRQAEQRERESRAARLGASSSVLQERVGPFVSASGLLALESLRLGHTLEADQSLRRALGLLVRPIARIDLAAEVEGAAFDAKSRRLAIATSRSTSVWSADGWRNVLTLSHTQSPTRYAIGLEVAAGVLVRVELDSEQPLREIKAWDINSGSEIFRWSVPGRPPSALALSPDARSLAFGTDDGVLRVVRLSEKETIEVPLAGQPLALYFSSPEDLYAGLATGDIVHVDSRSGAKTVVDNVTGSFTGGVTSDAGLALVDADRIAIWSPWRHAFNVIRPGERFFRVSLSPDASRVAVSLLEGVGVYSAQSGRRERTLQHPAAWPIEHFDVSGRFLRAESPDDEIQHVVHRMVFSMDGQRLVSAGADSTVRTWDLGTGLEVARVEHNGPVRVLALTDAYLVSGGEDTSVRVWDWTDRSDVRLRPAGLLSYDRPSMRIDASASHVASAIRYQKKGAGLRNKLIIQSLPDLTRVAELDANWIRSFVWDKDGTAIAIAVQDVGKADVRICSRSLSAPCKVKPLPSGAVDLAYSTDGRVLSMALGDRRVAFWDLVEDTLQIVDKAHTQDIVHITPLPDGRIVTGAQDGSVKIWNARSASVEKTLQFPGGVFSFDVSPDGAWLVAGSVDARVAKRPAIILLWNLKQDADPVRIEVVGTVFDLRFSPDSKFFVSAHADQLIVRRIPDGAVDGRTLVGDFGGAAISKDSKLLATSTIGAATGVRVWDIASRVEIHRLPTAGGPMIFGPDNRYLLTSGQLGSPDRHWLKLEDLQQDLCRRISRNLGPDERATYLTSSDSTCSCPTVPLWKSCSDPQSNIGASH